MPPVWQGEPGLPGVVGVRGIVGIPVSESVCVMPLKSWISLLCMPLLNRQSRYSLSFVTWTTIISNSGIARKARTRGTCRREGKIDIKYLTFKTTVNYLIPVSIMLQGDAGDVGVTGPIGPPGKDVRITLLVSIKWTSEYYPMVIHVNVIFSGCTWTRWRRRNARS